MIVLAYVVIVSVLLLMLGLALASQYFYNFAIKRSKKTFMHNNPDLDVVATLPTDPATNWVDMHGYEQVSIRSHDGLKLCAYYMEASPVTNRTVILAHGYASKGKYNANFARMYYEKFGFNVLMPDARGHGQSEGDYIGFGWPDRLDYLQWVNYIIERTGPIAEIVLHGISMGGATVLMTSGENLPHQVKAVVSDCAYSSVLEQVSYQLRRMYGLPAFPVVQVTSLLTKLKAGYTFDEASAVEQVKKARVPILFIHGTADAYVPFDMVHKLFEAALGEKDLYVVKGATHGMAYSANPEKYQEVVAEFLAKHMEM